MNWERTVHIVDPTVLELLRASGWDVDRKVDISEWVAKLEAAGYAMNRESRRVLSSFGGLTVLPATFDRQVYSPSPVRFDPLLLRWLGRPTPWEQKLGTVLSPLGECHEDSSLFIDEAGRLYAQWDALMECEGESFEDSLRTLLLADRRGRRVVL